MKVVEHTVLSGLHSTGQYVKAKVHITSHHITFYQIYTRKARMWKLEVI